jgi:hypothetical protein
MDDTSVQKLSHVDLRESNIKAKRVILSLIGSIPIQYGWERTGIASTVIRFLSTGAQPQAAPCNVGQGGVKNQLAMPQSSCASIETRQKQVVAPGSLPSELGDQQENAGINRLAASEGTAGQRTAMPRIPENFAIQYVSNVGSDAIAISQSPALKRSKGF